MSNTAKLRKRATEFEQKKQFDKALQLYIQLLNEAGRELDDSDLQLYNRVGDLLMRQGSTSEALGYYESAVDMYAERGFLNNAIALCSKILRQSPARTAVYYKLGKISASKGFKSDARKNFLEYADRMEKAGQRQEAFRALKEFADLCPDQEDVRLMLAEMLSKDNRKSEALDQLSALYEKLNVEGRDVEARATLNRMIAIDPNVPAPVAASNNSRKSNDLVFLDLSAEYGQSLAPPDDRAQTSSLEPTDPQQPGDEGDREDALNAPSLQGLEITFVPGWEQSDVSNSHPPVLDEVEPGPGEDLEHGASSLLDGLSLISPAMEDAVASLEAPDSPGIEDAIASDESSTDRRVQGLAHDSTIDAIDLLLATEFVPPSPIDIVAMPVPIVTHEMEAVSSPSPIDVVDVGGQPDAGLDLLAELASPFERGPATAGDSPAPEPAPIPGFELDAFELPVLSIAPEAQGLDPFALVDLILPVAAEAALEDAFAETATHATVEPTASDPSEATGAGPASEGLTSGSVEAAEAAMPCAVNMDTDESAESHHAADVPRDRTLTEEPVHAAVDPSNGASSVESEERIAAPAVAGHGECASALGPTVDGVERTSSDATDTGCHVPAATDTDSGDEQRVLAAATNDSTESTASIDTSTGGPTYPSANTSTEPQGQETDDNQQSGSGLLLDVPGFGVSDPEASTFHPSPRLSILTLQPDSWSSDETPEVLIDGEWHDEHVADAAHVASGEAPEDHARFDDLSAAMMWTPEEEGAPDAFAMSPILGSAHGHVSFGGVEDQLRRRLELVPENWALRRQLGEALLEAGDRDAGLYELDLAMVGHELSGNLDGAMDVADEIVRLIPSSVRHHQKRVEYSVRAGDRSRLVGAYMELGDALFRDGEVDKSIAVYSRVLELSPGHDGATFALSTLAPVGSVTESGIPTVVAVPDDAFSEWEPPAHVLDSFVSARSDEYPCLATECESASDCDQSTASDAPCRSEIDQAATEDPVTADLDESKRDASVETAKDADSAKIVAAAESSAGPSIELADSLVVASGAVETAALREVDSSDRRESGAPEAVGEPDPSMESDGIGAEGTGSQATVMDAGDPVRCHEEIFEGQQEPASPAENAPTLEVVVESALDVPALRASMPQLAADSHQSIIAPADPANAEGALIARARSMTPVGARDDEYVDLGEWLRMTEPPRTTRMVVAEAGPSGNEQADFEEMLRRFKLGIAENVDDEDFASHYDLGVAYKEMGLIDEAIAQFQRALRGEEHRIKSYEALGQCFVDKSQYAVATALLQRAADSSHGDDHRLVGVLYLLGYSMEMVGHRSEALRYYQRVFAVDIEFRDVVRRVAAMEHQPT
ncbi:MAG: hypothetical protein MNPFHGCM_02838 [Gemmatimonadaceae bacterium]|nr:hypothetical protein [Gemmatimonadaceae bacterium]